MGKMEAYKAKLLPVSEDNLTSTNYQESLIDASVRLEVYKTKLAGSKIDRMWFLPTLQQKEALASSMLEGTQATLDGILVDQVSPNEKDRNLLEVRNYLIAAEEGYKYLKDHTLSVDFIKKLHEILMHGNIRRNRTTIPGEFRTGQNWIGQGKNISYVPPVAESVEPLMANLVDYMIFPKDKLRPLVRTAIMHAQFETIHPFMDGNGRVGRILIPLYLYMQDQISLPCFFISEALERDKFKYYDLLNGIRTKNDWGAWIDFFLHTVEQQCGKYIAMIDDINSLYESDLEKAKSLIRNNKVVDLVNLLYTFPIINTAIVVKYAKIPPATATRYLNALSEAKIIYTDGKLRNRTFYYYGLLNIIRA